MQDTWAAAAGFVLAAAFYFRMWIVTRFGQHRGRFRWFRRGLLALMLATGFLIIKLQILD